MIQCKCGCGDLLNEIDNRGRPRYYKRGHNIKGNYDKTWAVRGENHYNWGGGRKQMGGYLLVLRHDHPNAESNGYIHEHRIVYEESRNCCLLRWAVVHHIDGNKLNNIWYNLEGMMKNKHDSNNMTEKHRTGKMPY